MGEPMRDLRALVEKSGDAELLREMLLELVAKRSFDPADRMKAEEGRRSAPRPAPSMARNAASGCPSGWRAACWGGIARHKKGRGRGAPMMRRSLPALSRSPRSMAAMATAGSQRCCERPAGR